ncbi:unnamed protein product [Mycena citricolor]|uniref:Uncharacterized protein n=1 Tax=Mycena citricolor TaxID=2018698 RepID=A0AAD2HP94_9AGAR|nr:unnamed protein product [Mycena citricolor]
MCAKAPCDLSMMFRASISVGAFVSCVWNVTANTASVSQTIEARSRLAPPTVQRPRLLADGLDDGRVAVPDADDGRAADRVRDAAAVLEVVVDPLRFHGQRRRLVCLVQHGRLAEGPEAGDISHGAVDLDLDDWE